MNYGSIPVGDEQETPPKRKRKPSVINWRAFCTLVLIHAKETRAQGFTRVSKKQVQPWAERMVWEKIIKPMVAQMPSKGVTIFPPVVSDD